MLDFDAEDDLVSEETPDYHPEDTQRVKDILVAIAKETDCSSPALVVMASQTPWFNIGNETGKGVARIFINGGEEFEDETVDAIKAFEFMMQEDYDDVELGHLYYVGDVSSAVVSVEPEAYGDDMFISYLIWTRGEVAIDFCEKIMKSSHEIMAGFKPDVTLN